MEMCQELIEQILKDPFKPGWHETGEAPLDRRYQKVIELMKNFNTFLEVGPGTGTVSFYLLSQGKKVSMLDLSDEDLTVFKSACEKYKYPYIFHKGNIAEPIFFVQSFYELSKPFDVVFACEVIEHITDYQKAINNMIELARSKVVLTTPVLAGYYSPDHKHFFLEQDFEFIEHPYTIERIITKEDDLLYGQENFLIEINIV